jgi:Fur family ferric uptake transcriptional regulator
MIASTQTNHPLTGVDSGKEQTPVELACYKLKEAGLRITQPRVSILAALIKAGRPTSIDNLHGELGPNACDIVTVYRCMAAFESIGLVRRAFLINGTSLYEINLGDPNRYHVVCKQTNKVEELDSASANELRRAVQLVEDTLRSQAHRRIFRQFARDLPRPVRGRRPRHDDELTAGGPRLGPPRSSAPPAPSRRRSRTRRRSRRGRSGA